MHHVFETSFSADLVAYLRDERHMTLRQIGGMIGVSESFISRVASGQRNFTLRHLDAFERQLGGSVSVLLLEAHRSHIPPGQKKFFEETLELLRGLGDLLRDIGPEPEDARKRRGLNEILARVEKRIIARTMRRARGDEAKAAEELQISRKALVEKLARYGLITSERSKRKSSATHA